MGRIGRGLWVPWFGEFVLDMLVACRVSSSKGFADCGIVRS